MNEFFENMKKLDVLKKLEQPTSRDLQNVIEIIRGDQELTRSFYDKNDRGELSAGWLELLDGSGEFTELELKEISIVGRIKAFYLVACASINPVTVLKIIQKIDAKDINIQGILINALVKMPEEIVVGGVPVVLEYIGGREYKVWFLAGERAAKFMVKLVENHPKEAFEIAKALLDVWRPGQKEAGIFETIRSKFATHEYKELIFDYYNKIWEKQPFEATRVLVDIYNGYLEECIKEKGYDAYAPQNGETCKV